VATRAKTFFSGWCNNMLFLSDPILS
jgi:hypothetical protein